LTAVKHEAFVLRRQRERHSPVTDNGELRNRPATGEQGLTRSHVPLGQRAPGWDVYQKSLAFCESEVVPKGRVVARSP